MSFLWNTHPVAPDLSSGREDELPKDMKPMEKPATTLEGLIAADPYPNSSTSADGNKDSDGVGDISGSCGIAVGSSSMNYVPTGDHSDVSEDEGWVTIPHKELSDGWSEADDILQLRSLDRSFVFPGEQLHILVCLKASKQETEVITPFKVAAAISKNSSSQNVKVENSKKPPTFTSDQGDVNYAHEGSANQSLVENGGTALTAEENGRGQDISATESLLRMEEHKQNTETLLERFKNSNFFARIAQSNKPLWSKSTAPEPSSVDLVMAGGKFHSNDDGSSKKTSASAVIIDRGSFDGNTSGGVARNTARCFSLCNGDIVVLLQVNVAKSSIKDPVLEVLQFEKYTARTSASENLDGVLDDPCHELLSWLLPLDRSLPPSRPLSPPLNSPSVLASASHRSTSSSSSGSQIFGHFRSYSMPTLPPLAGPSSVSPANSRPAFDLEDFDRFLSEKLTKGQDVGNDGLLSFRGVPLEPERFSVHCGLEGIFLPGRRWRRKLEIVQPIKIHSFAFGYATEDLLCVQIKNVCPAHLPDIIIFLDAISIVFEEASKGGPPISLPIASIETGNRHSLPNLALRRGEEHSFIMKPASTICANHKDFKKINSLLPNPKTGVSAPNMRIISRGNEGRKVSPTSDQYAVLVSCRSNYSESKLLFKQPTSWRPHGTKDLVVSVQSETSKQAVRLNGEAPRLPVQVLTLQASNLTSEDLTLTVVAPISSNSSPSVVSLNSGPTTPMSPFAVFPEFMGRVGLEKQKEGDASEKRANSLGMCTGTTSDVISSRDLGCTHLWLQSTVPLGCVPAHSSATVKLELLPLTDGIITLDTLQIAVKEKGEMYAPEQPLKIYVTSSISAGIL